MTATDTRPGPVLLGVFEPGSTEWWQVRRGKVGGSDVAAIMGLSNWESYFSLYHRHRGGIPPQDENEGMEWGKRLEPAIVSAFAEKHPGVVVRYPLGQVYAHPVRDWQVASPDGLLYEQGAALPYAGLEVKTDHVSEAWQWGEQGTDEIPPGYLAQVRWYLDTFGLDVWHVAVLIGGSDYREYVVERDDRHQAALREAALGFLTRLESGERPDIDAHTETYAAVRQLHPDIEDSDVELDQALAHGYVLARGELKAAETVAQHMTSLVADALGNGRRATFNGQTIATRQARGDGTPYLVCGRNLPTFEEQA